MAQQWDEWVDAALASLKIIFSTHPISPSPPSSPARHVITFDGPHHRERSSVEVHIDGPTLRRWLQECTPAGGDSDCSVSEGKMVLFSGNDYLGLTTHPSVTKAVTQASEEHGMGPRGSSVVCGHTNYHRMLEDALADLKKKEDCLLCPTGFSANMAFISALGSVSSLLAVGRKPSKEERVAIFSDSLNHGSIIDGLRLAKQRQEIEVFVYEHCDMVHLDTLLSCCTLEKKVVITDSLFSMDGDFAPMPKLVALRRKHGFLLVIDDAHGTLVFGENGGGIAELYQCENDVDVCIGTLSKAAGCQGGFIACSKKWRKLILSTGRTFIFSTSIPVPIVAAAHASLIVARKEKWRRRELWRRVHDFNSLTNLHVRSPIISVVVGSQDSALTANRYMLESGFHVRAIIPPAVPPNSCRLRITLSAAHTTDDIKRLVDALSRFIKLPHSEGENFRVSSKL